MPSDADIGGRAPAVPSAPRRGAGRRGPATACGTGAA
jgi:hypothetical protein